MENTDYRSSDPLGLAALASAIDAIRAAAGDPVAWNGAITRLDAAHRDLTVRMELLRDRYGLLKRTSAQLAEELAWLRDQLDDVRSAEASALRSAAPANPGVDHRRYTDRWSGGARRV